MKRFLSITLPALVAGACFRLFFVLKFPTTSGDAALYEQLAGNWLKWGKLAMDLNGQITPVDIRVPGYPAFLALIYAVTHRSGENARLAVMLAQVVVDLASCVIVALLAAVLARVAGQPTKANRAYIAALWLAVLCPFTANYTASILTETCAVFFTALAFLILVPVASDAFIKPEAMLTRKAIWKWAAVGGFVVGLGTMFRPETPLLLVTTFAVLGHWMVRRGAAMRWVRLCGILALGCAAALLPWTLRNATSLHEFQPLAPKDANLSSELDPKGFLAWEKTWLFRMRDVYDVAWKLNDEEIHFDDIPSRAFDTPDERQRVAMVLERYNDEVTWTPEEDVMFAQLARERTARHPLRTYILIPFLRAVTLWFSPRIELLPVSGHVFPLRYQFQEDPVDQRVTILMFFLNLCYVALAAWGAWKLWKYRRAHIAVATLLTYILVRTAFLTTMETPEPRYVLECFPALIALAAQVFWKPDVPEPRT
jgi:hypothetical protein